MGLTAKVESYCFRHNLGTKTITIEASECACINCIWYEPYFHENRGNLAGRVPTSIGYCLRHLRQRGALGQPCMDFETTSREGESHYDEI